MQRNCDIHRWNGTDTATRNLLPKRGIYIKDIPQSPSAPDVDPDWAVDIPAGCDTSALILYIDGSLIDATYDDTARSEIFRGFTEQRTFEVRKRKSFAPFSC